MSPWFIFTVVLGPFVLFTVWVVIAQVRGQFAKPQPIRTEPDFFQRHATLLISILVGGWSFSKGGIVGVIAAAVAVLILSLLAALIVTALEGRELRSKRGLGELDGDTSAVRRDPFLRRFARNFRSAIPDLLSYVS